MGVLGSIGINIGQNMISLGVSENPRQKPWRSKKWKIGFSIFLCFGVVNFSALAFAPATILMPLESIQLITNVIWNVFVNRAAVDRRMYIGVLLAIGGTILAGIVGPTSQCHRQEQMMGYWQQTAWIMYNSITLTAAALAFSFNCWLSWKERPACHPGLKPISFALYSAVLGGGQLVVHSKACSILLTSLISGESTFSSVFGSWFVYVELCLLICTGFFWPMQLTRSVALYDPLVIIPLMLGFGIIFGSLAGGLFFRELNQLLTSTMFGVPSWPLYSAGILCVITGLGAVGTSTGARPGKAPSGAVHPEEASKQSTASCGSKALDVERQSSTLCLGSDPELEATDLAEDSLDT